MAEPYTSQSNSLPPRFAATVTPGASALGTQETKCIYVGGTGDLHVKMAGDAATIIFVDIAAGVWHAMAVTHILAASTATDIVVGY